MNVLGVHYINGMFEAGIIDTDSGEIYSEIVRKTVPDPGSPKTVTELFKEVVQQFEGITRIGLSFPGIIQNGIVKTATSPNKSWIGLNPTRIFSEATAKSVQVINTIDAMGFAEIQFGSGLGHNGLVILLVFYNGIGTAVFNNGVLIPNTELGNLYYKDKVIEQYASDNTRKQEQLTWKKWGKRLSKYLQYLERVLNPELIIIGGSVRKKYEKYETYLHKVQTPIIPAHFENNGCIIGAAITSIHYQ